MISLIETIEEYHANEAIGSGDVRAFLRSPRLYADQRAGIGKKEKSAALSLGTLAHLFFLEPDRFLTDAVVKPDGMDGRTKEGKAWAEANANKLIVSTSDMATLGILKARMPLFVQALLGVDDAKAEVTYRAELDAIMCQCRNDWQFNDTDGKLVIYDLKTCQNVDDAAKSVWQYGYHIQAEWYKRVVHAETGKWPDFGFLFCETEAPYRWRIITLADELKVDADAKINLALAGIAKCRATGDWSDHSPIHQTVSAPKWAGLTNE